MEKINNNCPCRWKKCERYGQCEACREHHLLNKKIPPYCENKRRKAAKKEEQSK